MLKEWSEKKVLVVGMGMSGRSAAHFLLRHGARVTGVDRDENLLKTHPEIQKLVEEGLLVQKDRDLANCQEYEWVVVSPGIAPSHPLVQSSRERGIPIMGEIELGCRSVKNPIVGITGTNGKTTVTLLVTHVLNACGYRAKALGNVGVPFTQELMKLPSDVEIVLELSSYQIDTLDQRVLDAGLLLNITPDHLDRYGTMEAYAHSKCRLEQCIKPGRSLYVEERAWNEYRSLFSMPEKIRLYGYSERCFLFTDLVSVFRGGKKEFDLPAELKNKRSHDLENMMAAFAICSEKEITGDDFVSAWQSFKKPSHRIEFVMEHQGVRYYDDSKGTNLNAVERAVQSLDGKIILIAGGVDKGAPYVPWIEVFRNKVKYICAIGQAAVKIHEQLALHYPVIIFESLKEAVHHSARLAESGDIVLLSPGCSSFDMFKDYAHRGEEFQRIVKELALLEENPI